MNYSKLETEMVNIIELLYRSSIWGISEHKQLENAKQAMPILFVAFKNYSNLAVCCDMGWRTINT